MEIKADFYFDFGSPNAYLSYRVLPRIEKYTDVKFTKRPILLGGVFKATNNRSPFEAFAAIPAKLAYDRREMERFIERKGVEEFRMNPFFPINTLALMRGACAARLLDVFEPYVAAVYAAMWEDQKNMGDPAVITTVLREAGLPAEEILACSQDPEVKQTLLDETQDFVDRGGFGSPTFFVEDEMFFGKDRLRDVEEEILIRKQKATT